MILKIFLITKTVLESMLTYCVIAPPCFLYCIGIEMTSSWIGCSVFSQGVANYIFVGCKETGNFRSGLSFDYLLMAMSSTPSLKPTTYVFSACFLF